METRAQLGAVPRAVIVFATIVLLALATATAIAIGASNSTSLPAPFGAADNGLIAFTYAEDIYVVKPDGTNLRQTTATPQVEEGPSWSRDGKRLAYWSGTDEGPTDLIVTDAEGQDPVVIAHVEGEVTGEAWSEDGSEIMFSAVVPDLVSDICPAGEGSACGSRIFVAGTDGSGSRMVGDPDLDARGPELSPDGRTVAFGGGEAAWEALYLMDWDGSDIRRLSTGIPGRGWAFAKQSWSPDGRRIVTHDGSGTQSIWLVELDDYGALSEVRLLAFGFWPEYAPDGSRIRYHRSFSTIAVADPHSDEPPVTISQLSEDVWAPDATAFVAYKDGELVTFDRASESVVSIAPADEGSPAWQRVAE